MIGNDWMNGSKKRSLHRNAPAILALVLCAAFFAWGNAPASLSQSDGHQAQSQEAHGQGTHGQETAQPDAHAPADAHGEAPGEGHGDAHGGGHGGMPHLPNALTFLSQWLPGGAQFMADFTNPIFALFMAALLAVFFIGLSAKLSARNPGRAQMAVEMIFGGLYSLFRTIIGDTARRYTPYLGTVFIFILCNNLFGIIPLGHSATSSFKNTTLALGLLTFLYVQGIALKENGIGGYLFHLAGSPKSGVEWALIWLFFPLHVVGELIKPISLSLRLFGNIFGEDTLVATMVLLGAGISFSLSGGQPLVPGLPLQFPFYFLGLLSSTIQALVFTLLSTVYIALWLPHGHDDHAEAHGH